MILGVYRRLREVDHNVRTDQWRAIDTGLSTYTIHNKTVGIIGMGKIGQEVAKRLQGWGAKVIYHDAYVPQETVARRRFLFNSGRRLRRSRRKVFCLGHR
jgi:phosphoglycerate dehydrogenase-like enzyme